MTSADSGEGSGDQESRSHGLARTDLGLVLRLQIWTLGPQHSEGLARPCRHGQPSEAREPEAPPLMLLDLELLPRWVADENVEAGPLSEEDLGKEVGEVRRVEVA